MDKWITVKRRFERLHTYSRPLKNVSEAGKTRQKQPKKRSLGVLNEHSEAVFNDVLPTQVVFQRPDNDK